jgi:hypothetical protein
MEFKQAIELAGRYHFSLLTLLMKDGVNAVVTDKEKTFRLYEKMCDTIANDELATDKLVFLQKLPSVSKWSQDEAYLIMSDALNPFSDLKPFNVEPLDFSKGDIAVTIEELEKAYLSKFNPSDRLKAKSIMGQLKELHDLKNGDDGYREFLLTK